MAIDRKQMLISLLETIEGISDKDYQLRIWVRGEGPEVDDFEESSMYFSENEELISKNPHEFNVSDIQLNLLHQLREELDKFYYTIGLEHPPGDFIDTPEWTHITEVAKEILKAFHWKPILHK